MVKRIWFRQEKFQAVLEEQIRDYTSLGGNAAFGLVFLFLFIVGYLQQSHILIRAAQILLVSGVLFTVVGFGLKYLISRTRPNKESLKGASMFEKMNDASFPSIHSGRAIILAYAVGPLLPGYGTAFFYLAMLGVP
ncbi:MAG: phosphatase PAP2 family protein, partial [archaeon]